MNKQLSYIRMTNEIKIHTLYPIYTYLTRAISTSLFTRDRGQFDTPSMKSLKIKLKTQNCT